MPFCTKCGATLTEDDNFCPVCSAQQLKSHEKNSVFQPAILLTALKSCWHEGNVTRVIVKDATGKVLLELPVTVGAIGTVLAFWLAALGVIAALATNCRILVERRE